MKSTLTSLASISAGLILPLGFLLGCALDDDNNIVNVGQTSSAINLDQCYPNSDACGGNFDVKEVVLDQPTPAAVVGSELSMTSLFALSLCTAQPGCSEAILQARVSGEGTIWYLAKVDHFVGRGTTTYFVGHVQPDGTLLGQSELITLEGADSVGRLSVDNAGAASVLLYTAESENADAEVFEATRFYTLQPNASPSSETELSGIASPLIAEDGGDKVLLGNALGGANHGILSRIKWAGKLMQSNDAVPGPGANSGQRFAALTSHDEFGYSLLTMRSDLADAYEILRYSRNLEPDWRLKLPSVQSKDLGVWAGNMVSDSAGRLVVTLSESESQNLMAINEDGSLRFAWTVPGGLAAEGLCIDPKRERIWVPAAAQLATTATARASLVEVDVEAGTYQTHTFEVGEQWYPVSQLTVGDDGSLYGVSGATLVRFDEVPAE